MSQGSRSPAVGLVEACEDRRLFGAALELWPRQRELLAAVEDGPRLHVWALGRRSTKTTTAALVALWCCLLRPELRERLRAGERGYAVGVATRLAQSRLLVQAAGSIVEASPLLRRELVGRTEDELVFRNGNVLAGFPCTSRGGRGWPVFCLVLDELAHFFDTEGNSAAEAVWQALVPSTAQFGELGRVIAASTPFGQGGLFADLYQRAVSGELTDAVSQHATTAEANPTIEPGFLEQERARDPEGFKAEYEASFVSGGAAFLEPDRVEQAVADRDAFPAELGHSWVAGLDPAFSSDPFGLAIVGRDRQASDGRLVLGVARRWKTRRRARSLKGDRRFEDELLDEVAEVCLAYGARVVTDQHRAPGVVEYLRSRGLPVSVVPMTAQSKTAAFQALRARLYLEALELYPEPVLLAELRRLRSRFAAGQAQVVNPRVGDAHGDLAQALALAVWAHDRGGIVIPGDEEEEELPWRAQSRWERGLLSSTRFGMKL